MSEIRPPRTRVQFSVVVAVIVALGALGLAAYAVFAIKASDTEDALDTSERDKEHVQGQADQRADRTLELCRRGDKLAEMLRAAGECGAAAQLKEVVEVPGAQGIPGVPGVPGKDGKDGKPGPPPPQALLLRLIRGVYAENPPRDGVDGTTPDCWFEPAQCRGTDGADGRDGANGQDGRDGRDGDSMSGHRFERVDGDCRSITTVKRADGTTYEINSDAGEAACPGGP